MCGVVGDRSRMVDVDFQHVALIAEHANLDARDGIRETLKCQCNEPYDSGWSREYPARGE